MQKKLSTKPNCSYTFLIRQDFFLRVNGYPTIVKIILRKKMIYVKGGKVMPLGKFKQHFNKNYE